MPASCAAHTVSSGKKYISEKLVVPPAIISRSAKRLAAAMSSRTSLSSMGKIALKSQSCSGSPLPMPRMSVMAMWLWQLMSPGARSLPVISFSRSYAVCGRSVPM